MNRRQKIIVSVVGIFLVLLILVGLTYAYFLTKIQGNTKSTSITVKTANLALVYGDDDGSIIGEGEVITPNTTFTPKTFSVENTGNGTVEYSVVLDNVSITNVSTGDETSFESNDFVYTLTCTSGCNGVSTETTLPLYNNGILVSNSIDEGEKQTYSITITYKDTGVDQSDDMNKSLSARINIVDPNRINPYESNTSTLAYKIIDNAINVSSEKESKGYAKFRRTPLTKPASGTSAESENSLSATQDDYGTSYYYRGNVKNNYITFAGFTWRIVRINGDGTIRIILSDTTNYILNGATTGDTYYYGNESTGCFSTDCFAYDYGEASIIHKVENFFYNFLLDYFGDISDEIFCNDLTVSSDTDDGENISIIMSASARMATNPTLKCDEGNTSSKSRYTSSVKTIGNNITTNGKLTYPIGMLTADEVVFAGGKNSYLSGSAYGWFTMTPKGIYGNHSTDVFPNVYSVSTNGSLTSTEITSYDSGRVLGIRPVINLNAGTKFSSGDGTQDNPYTIK